MTDANFIVSIFFTCIIGFVIAFVNYKFIFKQLSTKSLNKLMILSVLVVITSTLVSANLFTLSHDQFWLIVLLLFHVLSCTTLLLVHILRVDVRRSSEEDTDKN